ncbi:MAG: hypothetical protein AB4206_09470 [Xenococcaceae cyanobacterium]
MSKKETELEREQRAERIQTTIALLQAQKSAIEGSGVVAPPRCYVARYQAKGAKHHYWYYQLKASSAIFPKTNQENEYSRFQHLGKAGSQAHIDGVLAVVRRGQIDELTKAIDELNDSWLDLYSNGKKVGHRVE